MSTVTIKEPCLRESRTLLELVAHQEERSPWLLDEAAESRLTPTLMAARLATLASQPNSHVLAAYAQGAMVGYLFAVGGHLAGTRHLTRINGLSVVEPWQGRGVAALLLDGLEGWARANGVTRLELMVMQGNEAALRLYERAGFTREGRHKRVYLVQGNYIDGVSMAKILDPQGEPT